MKFVQSAISSRKNEVQQKQKAFFRKNCAKVLRMETLLPGDLGEN